MTAHAPRLLLVAAMLCVPAVATAQPGMQPAAPLSALPDAPPPATAKDGTTATLLALGTTAAGLGMLAATDTVSGEDAALLGWSGLALAMIGPSAGHIYAGEYGHSVLTSVGRTAGVGAMFVGLVMSLDFCDDDCPDAHADDGTAGALLIGGSAALLGLTAYDLWDAHKAADRANRRLDLRLAPTALSTAHGPVGGLALSGRF